MTTVVEQGPSAGTAIGIIIAIIVIIAIVGIIAYFVWKGNQPMNRLENAIDQLPGQNGVFNGVQQQPNVLPAVTVAASRKPLRTGGAQTTLRQVLGRKL